MIRTKPPKKKRGRPGEYDSSMNERAFKLCLLGLTDKQLSIAFGVSEVTLNAWKKAHPDFLKSILAGKQDADAEIAKSLYHRAKGYSHPDVVITNYKGEITITDIVKHYPPDTKAALGWLYNRQKAYWRDSFRLEHTGKNGEPIEVNQHVDLSDCDDKELELLAKIGIRSTNARTPISGTN